MFSWYLSSFQNLKKGLRYRSKNSPLLRRWVLKVKRWRCAKSRKLPSAGQAWVSSPGQVQVKGKVEGEDGVRRGWGRRWVSGVSKYIMEACSRRRRRALSSALNLHLVLPPLTDHDTNYWAAFSEFEHCSETVVSSQCICAQVITTR